MTPRTRYIIASILRYGTAALLTSLAFYITQYTPFFKSTPLFLAYSAIAISALNLRFGPSLLSVVLTIIYLNLYYLGDLAHFKYEPLHLFETAVIAITSYYVISLIDYHKKLLLKLQQLSTTDSLTGLANRRLFFEKLNFLHELSKRDTTQFAVLWLDLDDFKLINDQYGHDAGDALLREVAQRLIQCVRAGDVVSRFGGDEFLILLPKIKTTDDSLLVAEKMRGKILEAYTIRNMVVSISCSFGIAIHPHHGTTPMELINRADTALYKAKNQGKNQIQIFQPD
jgi:diguanylate cyclase (GGDEF)-like protein